MSIELLSFVEWLQAVIDTFVSRAERIIIIIIIIIGPSQGCGCEDTQGRFVNFMSGSWTCCGHDLHYVSNVRDKLRNN